MGVNAAHKMLLKSTDNLIVFLTLSRSALVKVASRTLMKLTPDLKIREWQTIWRVNEKRKVPQPLRQMGENHI